MGITQTGTVAATEPVDLADREPFDSLGRLIMTTGELLVQRLVLVFRWYQGMVNHNTGMLEYLYVPQDDAFVRENCPIRDIASVWDVELFARFLNCQEMQPLVERSLQHFEEYLVSREGYLILDPDRLGEPSSIAHSAFLMLALMLTPLPQMPRPIAALAEGILRQQRPDGSYRVYFHYLPDEGEELYAGEAMLALLEAYRQLGDARYLQSVGRAFSYYDTQYFQLGRVVDDTLVFFANWQSQACRWLFEDTASAALKREVADFIYRLHDRIIDRGFYESVELHPKRQASVEVACALEGLNDAYALTCTAKDMRANRYHRCICVALAYLLRLQCTDMGTERKRGGFGLSLTDRRQRIDITGHAASAFMKSVENKIECGPQTI